MKKRYDVTHQHMIAIFIVTIAIIADVSSALRITSVEENKNVMVKQNAVLSWIITSRGDDTDLDDIQCSSMLAGSSTDTIVVVAQIDKQTGKFVVRIPQDGQLKYNHRLRAKHYSRSSLSIVIELTISGTEYQDTGTFVCSTVGSSAAGAAKVHLQIYRELNELKPFESVLRIGDNNGGRDTPKTILCAVPEPRVTMKFKGTITQLKGRSTTQNKMCYIYTMENITIQQQKHCGEVAQFLFQGVKKTIRRSVTVEMPLSPQPPQNAQILSIKKQDQRKLCSNVRWDGPNIGTCKATSLSYEVVVTAENEASTVLKRMIVYSNIVEICEIDLTESSGINLKVRTRVADQNSTWTLARLVPAKNSGAGAETGFLYPHMRIVIIGCAAVVILLLILLIVHCVYTHRRRCCRRFVKGKRRYDTDEGNESTPLKDFSQMERGGEQETTGKRKISRKNSTNDTTALMASTANDSIVSNGSANGRKNSTLAGGGKPEAGGKKDSLGPNHSQHDKRFYSLQRNIEREKKKIEELDFEQQEEEFYAHRRNTDSRILQDLRNTFARGVPVDPQSRGSLDHNQQPLSHNHHHPRSLPASGNNAILLSPSSLNNNASYAGDFDDYERQQQHPVTITPPVYDILPRNVNTRSTASTGSSTATGGRRSTFHEDFDDASSQQRKRYTNDSGAFSSENDPSPLYDVLPRSNTNSMPKQQTMKADQSPYNNYDVLPTNTNTNSLNRQQQPLKSDPLLNYDVLPTPNGSSLQGKELPLNNTPANYDVLPSGNRTVENNPHAFESANQAYDFIPQVKRNITNPPQDLDSPHQVPTETIYDVPARPPASDQVIVTTAPFSSHRKQAVST